MTTSTSDDSLLSKIANYTEILTKDPHSTVFVPLAEAFRQMGLLEDALEVAKKGVENVPRFCPGLVMLGRIQFEMNAVEEALASLQAAYDMDSQSLSALKGLARVLVHKGETGRARELLQKAVTLAPEDAGAGRMLATLPSSAEEPTAPAERPEDDPIATPTIAEIYLKQGLPHRALKVYRDLLKANPQNQELRQKLAALEQMLQAEAGTADAAAEPQAAPAAAPGPATAGGASPLAAGSGNPAFEAPERHLAILNRWLAAIRSRRAHV